MRSIVFAKRVVKEMLRDPLSYIFCLGFPIVMLIVMTVIDRSIPNETGMTIFHIQSLLPGVEVFGLTFIMLFTALQVSKDRSTAFLIRLYASPMRPIDFVCGYTLAISMIAVCQVIITFSVGFVMGQFTGYSFHIGYLIAGLLVLIPSALMFIGIGMFFGTLLNDKAAPGICSIIITVVSMLGGIWMDIDMIGGTITKIAHALPFYQGVNGARMAVLGNFGDLAKPLCIILIYAFIIYCASALVFGRKMKSDLT